MKIIVRTFISDFYYVLFTKLKWADGSWVEFLSINSNELLLSKEKQNRGNLYDFWLKS